MRLSVFNLYVEGFPRGGDALIHNTFSGAYVVMARAALASLRKMDRGETLAADALALLDLPAWTEPDVGIVVASREQEDADYQAWFEAHRTRRTLQCILAINLACNFDCPYCCQADVMDGSVMDTATIEGTADWLAARAVAAAVDTARITFVGGEPLLHADRIKSLAARLQARLDGHGVTLELGLITNGYFLTDEMVRELLPYGLVTAQVTLDGDHTTHHLTRVSRRGEDTFQRIFDNVIASSRHIRISVNGNYRADTVSGFAPLVDRLAAAGLPTTSPINFSPAFETLSAPQGSAAGTCSWSSASYAHQVALHDEIVGRGYATASLLSLGPCGFHDHHLFSIDPRGNIFKCPGFLGHPAWRIGHVSSGLGQRYEDMLALDTRTTCGGCAHRPNCGGGCVADAALRTGDVTVSCDRPFLEAIEPHALMREYLMVTSPDRESAMARFPAPPVALPRTPAHGVRPAALRVL